MDELPFAVESSPQQMRRSLQQSGSSLVTASSQGSFINEAGGSPLIPDTPQDVVLPDHRMRSSGKPGGGPLVSGPGILDEPEIIDFTYVNVTEMEEDDGGVLIDGNHVLFDQHRRSERTGNVLAVLLSGAQQEENETLVATIEEANRAAMSASDAKKQGDLQASLENHSEAAKAYRDVAAQIRDRNPSLAETLLLLSQTQAKSAIALKRILKLAPADLRQVFPSSSSASTASSAAATTNTTSSISQKERLRAAVRGALGSRHPHEADISESQFLGDASSTKEGSAQIISSSDDDHAKTEEGGTLLAGSEDSSTNPVDEMMELERELRDMDMALELGNSISSLDTRMNNRMKNSMVDGSFMVVPPDANSYMSTSMWGSGHMQGAPRPAQAAPTNNIGGTAGVRARANRVQNVLGASVTANRQIQHPPTVVQTSQRSNENGLESSWWGNAGSASQVLASSVISLGSRVGIDSEPQGGQPTDTKQLMRLMDSLKALGDENAALLREVEEAEAARMEAKAAREQMKRFKADYGNRFATLKKALEKFRKEHPQGSSASSSNPVSTSEYVRTASVTEQMQRQEQLIRKLTSDLKKEKEESKKKDAALRKYESFYREVKARSAQKAAQRQMETQQRQQKARSSRSQR